MADKSALTNALNTLALVNHKLAPSAIVVVVRFATDKATLAMFELIESVGTPITPTYL